MKYECGAMVQEKRRVLLGWQATHSSLLTHSREMCGKNVLTRSRFGVLYKYYDWAQSNTVLGGTVNRSWRESFEVSCPQSIRDEAMIGL